MRKYFIFSVISLSLLLSAINNSSASVAFSVMVEDLNTSIVAVGWVLIAYQLVSTVAMALAGKVSEVLGPRTAFITYLLLFSVGSALCALSPNIGLLIGARVIQAIGGGGFMPCAAGIVSDEFPQQRQRYIGLFSSIFPIGMIIGPNLGGWMVEVFGWRSIFWFNVPLGILVLVLSRLLFTPGSRKGSISSIDFVGAGLLFGAISAFMIGITELGNSETGISWVTIGILVVLSIGLLILFVRWEHRVKETIIDLELLRRKPFMAANIYNFLYGISALGVFSLIPLYAVSVYNMSILESGVALTPRSVGMMITSTITSFFLVRWGYRLPILIGTIIVGVSCVFLALQPEGIDIMGFFIGATPLLFIIVGLAGIGHGICTPASNNACIELMPDRVATITGLRGMFRILGSTFGIAVATMLLNSTNDFQYAFFIIFITSVVIALISIPVIFIMPASASAGSSFNKPAEK
jgi:EmrB/QacA subfamily drug resistance transporter